MPAVKYASIFNQGALLSNSPLYIDGYPYFKELTSILDQNGDVLVEETSVNQIIQKYGQPKYIILFTNENDKYHLRVSHETICTFIEGSRNGKDSGLSAF